MKRIFLLMVLMSVGMMAKAQNADHNPSSNGTEKQYYIYNIVSFSGNIKSEGIKVEVDNGKSVDRLLDKDGNKIVFKTPAAALMYFFAEGWELYVNGATTSGSSASGTGVVSTTSYWIMRKPCTKEEFEKAVHEGRKK